MFSMSIKHPKGRGMGAFYWFIGNCKFDSDSSMARILFGELARRDSLKKMDTEEEFRILSFDFSTQNFVSSLVMHPWFASPLALDVLSASKVCIEKNIRRIGTGKRLRWWAEKFWGFCCRCCLHQSIIRSGRPVIQRW